MVIFEPLKAQVCQDPAVKLRIDDDDILQASFSETITVNPVEIVTDETLHYVNGVLGVNTADEVTVDNTLPVTSAAVASTIGNIEILLGTI